MYEIRVLWSGRWVRLDLPLFGTKEAALWAVGQWKQANQCYGDPFRVEEVEPRREAKGSPREQPGVASSGR